MTENTDGTAESGGDVQRRMSLAGVDDVPDEHELTIDVELLESIVTAAHTAHLRVTATDESSRKRRLTIGTGRCNLFNRGKGQSRPKGLWLHAPSSTESIDRVGERWTADRDPDAARGFPMYGCGYPPAIHDEPIVNEYLVWDDYRVEGYMSPGTYRFETSIQVGGGSPISTATTATEPEAEFTWGFALAVENLE